VCVGGGGGGFQNGAQQGLLNPTQGKQQHLVHQVAVVSLPVNNRDCKEIKGTAVCFEPVLKLTLCSVVLCCVLCPVFVQV
jgi:hypothetical protein